MKMQRTNERKHEMTQEEKRLLLADLCARLPYEVQVEINGIYNGILKGVEGSVVSTDRGINYPLRLVRSYLRPWSDINYINREYSNICASWKEGMEKLRKEGLIDEMLFNRMSSPQLENVKNFIEKLPIKENM